MLVQIVIGICGITSIWLSQSASYQQRKWAPVVGLTAQPFWLIATLSAEQWGIAALTLIYTIGWARGLRTYWFARAV